LYLGKLTVSDFGGLWGKFPAFEVRKAHRKAGFHTKLVAFHAAKAGFQGFLAGTPFAFSSVNHHEKGSLYEQERTARIQVHDADALHN
jgi:hypothetical protein